MSDIHGGGASQNQVFDIPLLENQFQNIEHLRKLRTRFRGEKAIEIRIRPYLRKDQDFSVLLCVLFQKFQERLNFAGVQEAVSRLQEFASRLLQMKERVDQWVEKLRGYTAALVRNEL